MLKELQRYELPFAVLEAELNDGIDHHMRVLCGFFRVGSILMIQNGDNRHYFELKGSRAGQACGYLEAKEAYAAGELPAELSKLFEERDSKPTDGLEALINMLMAQYAEMNPLEVMLAAAMGDPIAQMFVAQMNNADDEEIQDDDGPPSAFTSFFNQL